MRRRFILFVLATIVVLICAEFPLPASARIKCWTNREGVRECGNVIPPEYAQKGHREMSSQGITIKEVAKAKTPEELRREREEQARLDAEKAEKERIASKRAEHDRVLLSTFATEGDLLLARDGKLQTIDSRIRHAHGIISQLQKKLTSLETHAAKLERSGKALPTELHHSIRDMEHRIAEHVAFIEARRKEQQIVRETFASDLERYRELRGPRL
jgi:DNA repair exonuclease SbcCD ATPase subunit